MIFSLLSLKTSSANDWWSVGGMSIFTLAWFVFGALRGLLRLGLFALSLIVGVVVWFFVLRHGHQWVSSLSGLSPGVMQGIGVSCGVIAFFVVRKLCGFLSGLIPSAGEKRFPIFHGGLTTVLIAGVIAWLLGIGIRYAGSLSELSIAYSQASRKSISAMDSAIQSASKGLNKSVLGSFLEKLDPFEDKARLQLASRVVTHVVFSENPSLARGLVTVIKGETSLIVAKLSLDKEIRQLVKNKSFAALLANPKLSTALENPEVYKSLKKQSSLVLQ